MDYDKPTEQVFDIVGKSTTVFYAPLAPEPEGESTMLTEPDVMSDEVEANLNTAYIPDDDELEQYRSNDLDVTGEISQGLTFQEISQAIDVVEGRKSGETEELLAAETLTLMPNEFLDMICMQANNESVVKKLIDSYVYSIGKVKPVPVATQLSDFDINQFV
jgi:hypothetical protein